MVLARLCLIMSIAAGALVAAHNAAAAPQRQAMTASAKLAARLQPGDGSFVFMGWRGPPLTVFTHLPPKVTATTPIVFVIHGHGRNAEGYRKGWAALADANGFIVAVPYFDSQRFADSASYNQGGIQNRDGTLRAKDQWAFATVEPMFDELRRRTGSRVATYALYGHSAGAQFVHRFLFLMRNPRVSVAVAANAGSYAMPVFDFDYPYGLRGAPVDKAQLARAFAVPLVVLLGTDDIDPDQKDLPREPEAMAQGPFRLARGQLFYAKAKAAADAMHVPFKWRLRFAEGAGHSNGKMAPFAAPLLGKGFVGRDTLSTLPAK